MPTINPELFKRKVESILAAAYGGLHNLPGKLKFVFHPDFQMASINVYGDLTTFDFSRLTWLVLAAHKECVRLEISPCNMRYLRLRFHPRLREGRISERHPSMDKAIEEFDASYKPVESGELTSDHISDVGKRRSYDTIHSVWAVCDMGGYDSLHVSSAKVKRQDYYIRACRLLGLYCSSCNGSSILIRLGDPMTPQQSIKKLKRIRALRLAEKITLASEFWTWDNLGKMDTINNRLFRIDRAMAVHERRLKDGI